MTMDCDKRICRLCLSQTQKYSEVSDNDCELKERIFNYLSIDIDVNDELSKFVCDVCIQQIENWRVFKERCQMSQMITTFERAGETTIQVKEVTVENITIKLEPEDGNPAEAQNDKVEITAGTFESADCGNTFTTNDGYQGQQTSPQDMEIEESPAINNAMMSSEDNQYMKIQFAAGLSLMKIDASSIDMDSLSNMEKSYLKKCQAMVDMFGSLTCACHLITYHNIKGLLSHLRSTKMWFPVFTCFHCMITFIDRSSSDKHLQKCPNKDLNQLVKLSHLKKRDSIKTRLYQNYRCTKCRFIFTFHEDFCKHIDEEHSDVLAPYNCSCQRTFDTFEDYKDHVSSSCLVEYFCDICNIAVGTLIEFINHAVLQHDNSDGFSLLQEHDKRKRLHHEIEPRENKSTSKKRRRSTFGRLQNGDHIDDEAQSRPNSSKRTPTACPQCNKIYSNNGNMLRHFRMHQDVQELKTQREDTALYRCPDCQIVYNDKDWKSHKETHKVLNCPECEELFLFQTELEQHRHRHLTGESETPCSESSDPRLLCCDICNISCENFEELENHRTSHGYSETERAPIEVSEYSCLSCNKYFSSNAEYTSHTDKFHTDRKTSSGASHKAMHSKRMDKSQRAPLEKPESRKLVCEETEDYHTCGSCFKVFANRYLMKKHMRTHGNKINPSLTSKSPHNSAGNSHMDEHNEDMLNSTEGFNNEHYIFTCEICAKSFPNKFDLIRHKTEQHVKDAGPSKTSLAYRKLSDITLGMSVASDNQTSAESSVNSGTPKTNETILCKLCDKSFQSQRAMNSHLGWHKRTNNEEPAVKESETQNEFGRVEFQCDVCGKELPNQVALKIHEIEKHGDVAAFLTPKCESCNQEFKSRNEYENHMKLHEIFEGL